MCSTADAGILVSRSEQGLQFTDAIAVTFNAKDKALSLGDQSKLSGPISKLPTTHLEGVLLKDSDAGVLAHFEEGKAEYLLPRVCPRLRRITPRPSGRLPKSLTRNPRRIRPEPISRRRRSSRSSPRAPKNSPGFAWTTPRSN